MSDTDSETETRRSAPTATVATGSVSAAHSKRDIDTHTTDLATASNISFSEPSQDLLARVHAQAAQLTAPTADEEQEGTEYDQRLRAIQDQLRRAEWGEDDESRARTARLAMVFLCL